MYYFSVKSVNTDTDHYIKETTLGVQKSKLVGLSLASRTGSVG